MNRLLLYCSIVLINICCSSSAAFALKYTSVASGNFSSNTTWLGGVVPPVNINTSDTVLIESGHNVILDQDITFSQATAMLDVRGILRSSGSKHINFNGSSIMNISGTLDIDSMTIANVTNANISGQCTIKKLRCLIFSPSGSGNVVVTERLYVYGSLSNTGGNTINIAPNVVIYMMGGQIIPTGTGIFTLPSVYDVIYSNSAHLQPTGIEATGTGLRNVTIDLLTDTSELKLGADLGIGSGTLTLTKGILSLNNNNLRFGSNGDLAASGTGKLKSTSASDIEINTTGTLSGQLQFASNGNTVGNLYINSGGVVKLGSHLKVTTKVHFNNGRLDVQSNKLSLITGAAILGANANMYIITGVGGSLASDIGSGASFTYHIGTSAEYAPCIISSNNNTVYNGMSVGVNPGVKVFGTSGNNMAVSQPMVNATWFIEHINNTVDIDVEVMWSAAMEVNMFNRGNAYISHLIGNYWDKPARKPASLNSNGLFSIDRSDITSLSPFAVFDNTTVGIPEANTTDDVFKIYPNPAKNTLNISTSRENTILIYNAGGQLILKRQLQQGDNCLDISNLQNGTYYIVTGNNSYGFIKH